MESLSNQSQFRGESLQIDDLKSLSGIIRKLESDSSLARQITTIEVDEKAVDESELDAGGDPPVIPPEAYEKFGIEMSHVINDIQKHGGVEAFKWTGVDQKNIRPAVFWESLWKTAATLKRLNIEFSVHELEKLSKLTPPSVEFPLLETLDIDAAAAHGDNGSLVETILQNSPAIQDLDLSFPTCDLEGCRLQGITWQYTFPSLQTFDLRTYNSDNAALSDFHQRHPKITTLAWDVDADDGFVFPENSLPELRAISMDFRGRSELLKANIEFLAQCKHLAHLRVNGCPHASYPEIAQLVSLKCLELEPMVYSWREGLEDANEEFDEDDERRAAALEAETGFKTLSGIIGSMLEKMKGLQELSMDLTTGNTYFRNDEGVFGNPDPMDVKDLKSVIKILPRDTQIRALRLSDERGLKLSDEILENFPEVPRSLEYLKWDIGEKGLLYRLERKGGRVRAVECEALRKFPGRKSWVEERVLEY